MTRLQGEIVAEVSILMNTGSATTAIAMTNVLYQRVKNPKTVEKLIEEIDDALNEEENQPKDGVIPCDKVRYLPYLRAGLDESLRLSR
jgi:cytochrome P450